MSTPNGIQQTTHETPDEKEAWLQRLADLFSAPQNLGYEPYNPPSLKDEDLSPSIYECIVDDISVGVKTIDRYYLFLNKLKIARKALIDSITVSNLSNEKYCLSELCSIRSEMFYKYQSINSCDGEGLTEEDLVDFYTKYIEHLYEKQRRYLLIKHFSDSPHLKSLIANKCYHAHQSVKGYVIVCEV